MLLGIDTSGAVSVAVARGALTGDGAPPEVLAVRSDTRSRHHDEVLLPLIEQTLEEAGTSRAELTGVVVGRGPGPFTGLRVGLVSARSMAAVLGVSLHGLSSLDALAHQALAAHPDGGEGPDSVGVALDARRREVYHARYRRDPAGAITRTAEPAVAAPADVADLLTACDLLVGSGTALYPELLPATDELVHVDAGHLLLAAAALSARGEDLTSTEPMYLREPDAAKPTARKSALGR
ncbi:tRNA (adenosine(37)-N6)-threonylcarbamoyltransferase complex dimerization subunit type 1 TsaB [Brachybacterium saurashtrense]|uniref:tRNA (Adenosine(37)-N6)-threonylcarbamoyltransferase complex dimerization subunit type 1 TsaB n=1 Tax=Brachybacterium saurashtrense TaxID=556288 RepID=A0A345YP89_9MICO|nr:tRNA (adenosine(37)-N6)-threonylcarbamoyltransferase complex dimerization subunit type 1 TsaB [Brachybacterium saurashtrense]AXK45741.1 tRNA (adenosine(37)-N6)-threonylcarbamoyltransferase complex dimerization subunit type 1 TsaB [Brachybacterium saurashtrense]RRR24759.1 tRNA (adenosine(37)-N6)-threonylcarbamoyltransferase complex dimerization subunit type 1 TsaB [Brachybacterium saurashtrense]